MNVTPRRRLLRVARSARGAAIAAYPRKPNPGPGSAQQPVRFPPLCVNRIQAVMANFRSVALVVRHVPASYVHGTIGFAGMHRAWWWRKASQMRHHRLSSRHDVREDAWSLDAFASLFGYQDGSDRASLTSLVVFRSAEFSGCKPLCGSRVKWLKYGAGALHHCLIATKKKSQLFDTVLGETETADPACPQNSVCFPI